MEKDIASLITLVNKAVARISSIESGLTTIRSDMSLLRDEVRGMKGWSRGCGKCHNIRAEPDAGECKVSREGQFGNENKDDCMNGVKGEPGEALQSGGFGSVLHEQEKWAKDEMMDSSKLVGRQPWEHDASKEVESVEFIYKKDAVKANDTYDIGCAQWSKLNRMGTGTSSGYRVKTMDEIKQEPPEELKSNLGTQFWGQKDQGKCGSFAQTKSGQTAESCDDCIEIAGDEANKYFGREPVKRTGGPHIADGRRKSSSVRQWFMMTPKYIMFVYYATVL